METKINFSLKKMSPMKYRTKSKTSKNNCNNYFIKINDEDENWFNLKNIYDIIYYGNKLHPITNILISDEDIEKIKHLYNNIIEVSGEKIEKDENKLLSDSLELFENQIEELYNSQEETYSFIQQQQHIIDKLKSKLIS
jgi:hypothetical protein